ncbi:MAG: DNA-3-methyladenine glycosylase I [Gammaproteobacteria bacterium]|nr:DNA-3-methyladenine glycosylase I [Gammaproteobacteria bacterium]
MTRKKTEIKRCGWAANAGPLDMAYHDKEWGVPVHRDRVLFEFLILEGAQAGLSWSTILNKRRAYREAFSSFDPVKVARYNKRRIGSLMKNAGIVRNRLKIESTISNARAFLEIREEFRTFNNYLWRFVDGEPIVNKWKRMSQVPASTKVSDTLSKDLKKRGFRFVGTTICYAYMQAVGMVNDHLVSCFRYHEV